MKRKIVIFGASSAIAKSTARLYASKGAEFFLVARNQEKLDVIKEDLLARGALLVKEAVCDLSQSDQHQDLFKKIKNSFSDFNTALVAYGSLGDQKSCEEDFHEVQKEFETNFVSVVSILTRLANYFSQRKEGTVAVISSVAGDRGRQSNYIYGAAKGALTVTLQGLRNRLHSENIRVITIKPGFVDTPMTADIKKNFLFVKSDYVAECIHDAIEKGKDIVYVPWFWRYIMLIIKIIPEVIFKRLKL